MMSMMSLPMLVLVADGAINCCVLVSVVGEGTPRAIDQHSMFHHNIFDQQIVANVDVSTTTTTTLGSNLKSAKTAADSATLTRNIITFGMHASLCLRLSTSHRSPSTLLVHIMCSPLLCISFNIITNLQGGWACTVRRQAKAYPQVWASSMMLLGIGGGGDIGIHRRLCLHVITMILPQ